MKIHEGLPQTNQPTMNSKTFFSTLLAFACLFTSAMSQIEAGQSVIVKIMGVPADQKAMVDETYPISEEGSINLPFVGELPAAGKSSGQLSKEIQKAYRDGGIFKNPVIQVLANKEDINPQEQRVHIGGQVRNPGPKPFRDGFTVFQAVQAAGGATEFGAMNRVVLYRNGKPKEIDLKTVDGKAVVAKSDDTIEVPRKNWRGQ